MKKYLVKIKNGQNAGQIVGPFPLERIGGFFKQGLLYGDEDYSVYPDGEWKSCQETEDVEALLLSIVGRKEGLTELRRGPVSEETLLVDRVKEVQDDHASEIRRKEQENFEKLKEIEKIQYREDIKAFPVPLNINSMDMPKEESNADELEQEKSYREEIQNEIKKVLTSQKKETPRENTRAHKKGTAQDPDAELERTRVKPLSHHELLVVARLQREREEQEADDAAKAAGLARAEEIALIEMPRELTPEEIKKNLINEATQVFKAKDYLPEIIKKSDRVGLQFDAEERAIEEEAKNTIEREEEDEEVTLFGKASHLLIDKTKKKGVRPVILITLVLVIGMLLYDDDFQAPKGPPIIYPMVNFPVPLKVADPSSSQSNFKRGQSEYARGTYEGKITAALAWKLSLDQSFADNPALGQLLITYGELVPFFKYPKEKILAGQKIFQLMQIGRRKILVDENIAMGTAIFFSNYGKLDAALATMSNFVRARDKRNQEEKVKTKAGAKFFAVYLQLLLQKGKFVEAKKIYESLLPSLHTNIDVDLALIDYLLVDNLYPEARKLIKGSLESDKIKDHVELLLREASIAVSLQEFTKLPEILAKIQKKEFDHNPRTYSKFLEYQAILLVLKKDYKGAASTFREALKWYDSEDLRAKLAAALGGGDQEIQKLILESQVRNYMKKAQRAMQEDNWEEAFKNAISASDISENYRPARLLLAQIQIKQGYYSLAIDALLNLKRKYPLDAHIQFELVHAYIEAYKFNDAKALLSVLKSGPMGEGPEMASLFGHFYMKMNNLGLSYNWFRESITLNPLNDEDYFLLAKALVDKKQFSRARMYILNAMELNPTNIRYKALYANILYETENADTAIGYIRDALIDSPNDPVLLGEIAIYYFKSGQIKSFEVERKKLEAFTTRDPVLHTILIEAARLENNNPKVIEYTQEYLKLVPGNLKMRFDFADFLIKSGQLNKALEQLEFIKERLPSYPDVHFLLARIAYSKGDLKVAEEMANEELKLNLNSDQAMTMKGRIFAQQNKMVEAVAALRTALTYNQNALDAILEMAWIKFSHDEFDEAFSLYQRALRIDVNNPIIHKQLGYIYRTKGQGTLAIESFKVYLNLSPDVQDRAEIEALMKEME